MTIANNPLGIFLPGGTLQSPFEAGRFVIEKNGVGLNFTDGAQAIIVGGLSVHGNQTGVRGDAADTLTLVSVPDNPSAITGNVTDVNLSFGTRVTIGGVAIGTMACDGTVLSRGTTTC